MKETGAMREVSSVQLQKQLRLEEEALQFSMSRYSLKKSKEPLDTLPPGEALVRQFTMKLSEALDEWKIDRHYVRYGGARTFLKAVPSDEAAFITIKTILSTFGRPPVPLQTLAAEVASRLREHMEYREFKKDHPGYIFTLEKKLRERGSTLVHSRRVLRSRMMVKGLEKYAFKDKEKYYVGLCMIDLMIESTGLIHRVPMQGGRRKSPKHRAAYTAVPTAATLAWLERADLKASLLTPFCYPMVVPPLPWTSLFSGGFLTNGGALKYKLVKTRNNEALKTLIDGDLTSTFDAINILQETRWKINTEVLNVLKYAWEQSIPVEGLVERDVEELPEKPWVFENREPEAKELRIWKNKASEVYFARSRTISKRAAIMSKIQIADKMASEAEIYFCWNLDWRGRMYPLQNYVNPQSDDIGRGLLQFAEGKPLGDKGAFWLAVHGANCFGFDKASFEERFKWVKMNEEVILSVAADPFGAMHPFWANTAKNPFQFLAFCFEWRVYTDNQFSPYTLSYLPVQMDGSCNGLQNFSAMLRDEIGGAAVNLVPSDKPRDIYQEVATVLERSIVADAEKGKEEALPWIGKVTRDLTKRATMTTPYGVSLYGIREQLRSDFARKNYLGIESPDGTDWKYYRYLGEKLFDAIGKVVVSARLAMTWLQDVSKVVSHLEQPIIWTTPTGFRPRQEYRLFKAKRIKTFWGSGSVYAYLQILQESEKINKKRQANGIAPNFIHSLDASHAMLTILKAYESGIDAFSMVHDSYGTHAGNVEALGDILREAFISIYSENILENFRNEVLEQLPTEELRAKIPPVPEYGTLDLSGIRKSSYFFS